MADKVVIAINIQPDEEPEDLAKSELKRYFLGMG